MKPLKTTTLLLSLAAFSAQAPAALPLAFYDSFSDPVATPAVPATWTELVQGTDAGHSRIDAGSLSYPGYAASIGNSWGLGQKVNDYRRSVPDLTGLVAGDHVYYSFLFQMNTPLDPFNSGSFRLFNSAAATGSGLNVSWGTADFNSNLMGFSLSNRNRNYSSAVGVDNQKTSEIFPIANTTYLIVVGYNRGANAAGSSIDLWVNPAASSFGATPPPTSTINMLSYQNATGYNNEANWDTLDWISNGSGAGVTNWQVDEFRAGTVWSEVVPVPEPATLALLLGCGALGLALWRRR